MYIQLTKVVILPQIVSNQAVIGSGDFFFFKEVKFSPLKLAPEKIEPEILKK
jgi:hypothetical protein